MKLFKPSYTRPVPDDAKIVTRKGKRFARFNDRKGKTVTVPLTVTKKGERLVYESPCYGVGFVDNKQIRRRLPLFSDKRASERAAQKIEELLSCGGGMTAELQRWLETLPVKQKSKLIEWQIVEGRRLSENLGKSLLEHLEDFCDGLAADGAKAYYVRQTRRAISLILEGCRFTFWSDIDGTAVKTFLAKGRGPNGYGQRTYNSRLRALKEFTVWLLNEDRVPGWKDPMKGHNLIKQTEFRKVRRPLTIEEMHKMLSVVESAPQRFNMSGHERGLVYRMALECGLRAGEVKTLRKLSFDLDAKPANVHIDPSDTKSKRPADLVLMDETARAIREHLAGKEPTDRAFGMCHNANAAKMLKADLQDAGIEYTDASGRDVDFHALRHTFITNLALAKVHPAVAQKMARHSSIELTMKFYTHVLRPSEVQAVDALKALSDTKKPKADSGGGECLSRA